MNDHQTFSYIDHAAIDPSSTNPRKTLGDITEMTESVKKKGIIEPLIVRKHPKKAGRFELVCGWRRWSAAGKAGLVQVPCIIRELGDDEVLDVQLAENIDRTDLTPLEEAEAYRLRVERGQTLEHVADRISRSPGYVARRLKLLELGKDAQAALAKGEISVTVAEMIGRIPEKLQKRAVESVAGGPYERGASNAEASRTLREQFMLVLKDARFDRADTALVPKAGACTVCPHRTGNQAELFSDVDDKDLCTAPDCFAAKTKAAAKVKLAAARKEGKKVLAAAEAKKDVFPYGDSVSSSKYQDLDGHIWDGSKRVPVRKLLAGKEFETVFAVSPKGGMLHELVSQGVVNAALRRGKPAAQKNTNDKSAAKRDAAARQKAKAKAEIKDQVTRRAIANAVAVVEKGGGRCVEACLRVVLDVVARSSEYCGRAEDRRGLKEKKALEALGAKADHAALVGILFELALWELSEAYVPRDAKAFDEALKIVGIDRAGIEKAVAAEREPVKPVVASVHFRSALGGYLCRVKPSTKTGFGGTNSPSNVTCPACAKLLEANKAPPKPATKGKAKTRGKAANGSPARGSKPARMPAPDGEGTVGVNDDGDVVCRGCGCSEFDPCTSGCSWVEADLCSACAGEQPRGKGKRKGAASKPKKRDRAAEIGF